MLTYSILALVGVFLFSVFFGSGRVDFGYRHYWVDETMHFLGGFFMAMFLANFFQSTNLILIGLALVTFLWELAEVLLPKASKLVKYLKKNFKQKVEKPRIGDTIFDIVLNFSGALLFIYLF